MKNMKKLSFLKRIIALALVCTVLGLFAGCGEVDQPTVSELQSKAKSMSKTEAEKNYKSIVALINERADLIPEFIEEEKDHTTLKLDADAYNDVLTAREAVKAAKTKEDLANACVQLDEAIFYWLFAANSLNPNTKDACYLALQEEISNTSKRLSSLITNHNNLVETYNKTASKENKMEKFVLPASDLIESTTETK